MIASARRRSARAILLLLLVLACVLFSQGCGRRTPPYSPAQALKMFELPEGFRIELVAAEPEIADPVAMAFDERGRLFVVEMPGYPLEKKPLGRIKLLEDRDGDGRYEKSTVFAEGLTFANGILPWKGGVLVTSAPDILYLADTDGDNRADVRRVVLTGFAKTNPQLLVNGLRYGMDNWIYAAYPKVGMPRRFVEEFGDLGRPIQFAGHPEVPAVDIFKQGMDLRFKPDALKLEPVAGNSQYGNIFDAWGNRFTVWNNDHVRHVVIQSRYLGRNPYLGVKSGMQSVSDHENAASVYAVTVQPLHIHESEIGHFTSACGIGIYSGGQFPPPFDGAFFVCEPAHNLVHADVLVRNGATFTASRARQNAEFLASRDSWFRPVFTDVGPDGALYVVDYYRKVIDHPEWLPPEMLKRPDLREGADRGRIYRIVSTSSGTSSGTSTLAKPAAMPLDRDALVRQLSDPNLWRRITAQRLLVERGDTSVVPALREQARNAASVLGRVHALWTLEGLNALQVESVLQAMNDQSPAVREHAIRLAEGSLASLSHAQVRARLLELAHDPDVRVQYQAACTLGQVPGRESFETLLGIALAHVEDSWFALAALTAAAENANQWFQRVISTRSFVEAPSKGKQEFVRRITSIIGARRKEPEVAQVLAAARPAGSWWSVAGLEGLAEGLKRGSGSRVKFSPAGQRILLSLLESPSLELRGGALRVAVESQVSDTPQLRALLKKASGAAQAPSAGLEERLHAVGLLALDQNGAAIPLLERLLTPQEPEKVQVAAVVALNNLRDARAVGILLDRWSSYTAPVRDAALPGLFREPGRISALLGAIASGKVQAWSVNPARRAQLLRSSDTEIRKRAEAVFAGMENNSRKQVMDRYRAALGLKGDGSRGKDVFLRNCSKCHKAEDRGNEVGPNLASLTNRTREMLLADILDPSAAIAPGYEEYLIETTDGGSVTGIVARETATTVTVRREEAEETILRSKIRELRALRVSQMPEDLDKRISVQEMADLLAYLKTLGAKQQMAHSHD